MKILTLQKVLFVASVCCLVMGISLAGGSLGKTVKWNVYDSETNYGSGTVFFKIFAYQTLWTSYDIWNGTNDFEHAQAYQIIKNDLWRPFARELIMASAGAGGLSLITLLNFSLIPYLQKKTICLFIGRTVSSALSVIAGSMLGINLHYYNSNYPSLHSPAYYDSMSFYPHEDNPSTGFYMTAIASACLLVSATLNTINNVLLFKASKTTVNPTVELTAS